MAMQRWDPFRDALSLRDVMDRLLSESFIRPTGIGPGALAAATTLAFPIDLQETNNEYVLRASLPGFRPEEVNVTVTGDTVTIRAQHSEDRRRELEQGNFLLRERRIGAVMRSIVLPERVNPDQVQARFDNGELILTMPKSPENRPRQIQISPGAQQRQMAAQTQTGQQAGAEQLMREQPAGAEAPVGQQAVPAERPAQPRTGAETPPAGQQQTQADQQRPGQPGT